MFTGISFARVLREAAPGLSRRLFNCQCQGTGSQRLNAETRAAFRKAGAASCISSTARQPIPVRSFRRANVGSIRWFMASSRSRAASTSAAAAQAVKRSRWPETSSNVVAYWLLGSAASVFGIVVFGGLTRLTESGCVHLAHQNKHF